ncbi:protein ETHYLENE-INSENSITIVE 2 isoform X1 [Iris pallida]|uniref:Protein ETHYLENE-INSENSITIVE 2 isoform X1 n=1 Tax=Iris pallida TaxID=29817 RepID=A0AAX6H449_IRIPA|nr:protein ETHYLENE-INSENSITIVE 2 isoform X1 [Iris pallida]
MASADSGGAPLSLFPSLGPALMISMGYIDIGKWVAAVDGGAHFGFDLVFLVLLFNCIAILCQYLATCIGAATKKDLAEICSEEYCRAACILLGLQAELSMIISDVTTILGIAYGLNLLFGVELVTCIFFATVGSVLLPSLLSLLKSCKAEAFYISIASFTLLFYVLGVLTSQPEVPLIMNVIFPKLSWESAYSLMALLGANITVHNFYIHSSIVKHQKRRANVAMGALFHDHFFAILFIFTGIFLVNYVLMNSAASLFGSIDTVFNFQDAAILMDQIFGSPVAPAAFLLVLLFSSQITALTQSIGGQVILSCFFGVDLSPWVHRVFVKVLSIIPVLCCVNSAGAEGIYQLLIFCQVILAMFLPSSVIPLFRVASSRSIMGAFKTSWYLEILALLAFLLMLSSNVFFVIEMLFGNNSWMINLMGGTESIAVIPYTVLLVIACVSIGLTLHLAVTPLKSASDRPDIHIWAMDLQKDQPEVSESENDINLIKYDETQEYAVEDAMEKSVEDQSDKSTLEFNLDLPETVVHSDQDSRQSAHDSSVTLPCELPRYHIEESTSVVEEDFKETSRKVSAGGPLDEGIYEIIESKDPVAKDVGAQACVFLDRDSEGGNALQPDNSLKRDPPAPTSEGTESFNNTESFNSIKGKASDGDNGSGSLSKLSGLGRAARRQLAAILDEFWGNLFDFHGKLTQEANTNRLDVWLGLDLRTVGPTVKEEATRAESSRSYFSDAEMGQIFPTNQRDYDTPNQKKNYSPELPFGVKMGSSSWSQNLQTANVQSSSTNLLEPSERPYSSLQLPQYSDSRDYQPATIHGYQIASYLRDIGATRTPYSSISQNLPPTPISTAPSIPHLRDQIMYTRGQSDLGSLGTSLLNPALSRISRLQAEKPYYEPSFGEPSDHVGSSAYTKKYHSSPDISALIALSRNAYLNEGRGGAPIGPRPSSGRIASEQSPYLNPIPNSRVPLVFDQISPPTIHRDVFSLQPSLNPDAKSLWSRQPFEQLFGVPGKGPSGQDGGQERPSLNTKGTFPYAESGAQLLQSFRLCIMKLLKLEGSEWLFSQNGGSDEELIDCIATVERHRHRADACEINQLLIGELQNSSSDQKFASFKGSRGADLPRFQSIPNCGDGCIWQASLVVRFGIWCIRRILELSLVESRPELWGKYTYVLNRLQGIIEPAFFKPRQPLAVCSCLKESSEDMNIFNIVPQNGFPRTMEKPNNRSLTTASLVLEIIRDVETAVSGRKGRTGTAAGDVAFPKGKENLASVLKRYKRRLLNKNTSTNDGTSLSRRVPSSASSLVL